MFSNQPKGLYILALANTGERFGYYTVVSVLLFYLQAKFGYDTAVAGQFIGGFMAFVYLMPLFGGWLADRWSFSKCVAAGLVVMGLGYLVIALPTPIRSVEATVLLLAGMLLVGLGTGLFKSNLQVMIGDLYNEPRYAAQRDAAFSIFYMAINVGAMFAPAMASLVNDWVLNSHGLVYNGQLADCSNAIVNAGSLAAVSPDLIASLESAASQCGLTVGGPMDFAETYVKALAKGYGYSFGVAFVSIVVSQLIYFFGRKTYSHIVYTKGKDEGNKAVYSGPELTPQQTRSRLFALFFVFAVVIFFWMVFMQNSVTLSEFAKSCTTPTPGGWTRIGFNIWGLLTIAVGVYAGFQVFQAGKAKTRIIAGIILLVALGILAYLYITTPDPLLNVQPQDYQQFNGFFIVILTPFSLAFFGWLANKGKEPSAPRKIGYGMVLASLAYLIMLVGSLGIYGTTASVSSNWLISTYLMLTLAELLLSPMGISFVSKVAPPKYKGAMMGCWFLSTAIGNYLISIPMILWGKIPVWAVWGILICLCLISAGLIFSMLKKLEAATA